MTVVVFAAFGSTAGSVVLVGSIMLAGVDAHAGISRGQTLGWFLAGMRLVARHDGAPLGYRGIVRARESSFADIRRGRDPLAPSIGVSSFAGTPTVATPREAWSPTILLPQAPGRSAGNSEPLPDAFDGVEDARDDTILRPSAEQQRRLLVVNGTATYPLGSRTYVGRNPNGDDGHVAISVADLSRLMSKTHLLIENTAQGELFATDLGSTNGTTLERTPGQAVHDLDPYVRTKLDPSSVLRIGEHVLAFLSRGKARGGA